MEAIKTKTRSGKEVYVLKLSEGESPFDDDCDSEGMCIYCGNFQGGVEPDAEKYECEGCGTNSVYGLEQLFVIGYAR